MGKYAAAFSALPRAMKWAIVGLAVILVYFAAVEPMVERINAVASTADGYEAKVLSFTSADGTRKKALQTLELGLRHYGDVAFVGDESTRTLEFNSAVDKVLRQHSVSGSKSSTKNVSLGQGTLSAKLGSDMRVTRVVRDIEFDATPEDVAAVVAALEQTPVVATLSRVSIRAIDGKESERLVHATITAEAWISAKKG
jgi:hypothetical protein